MPLLNKSTVVIENNIEFLTPKLKRWLINEKVKTVTAKTATAQTGIVLI